MQNGKSTKGFVLGIILLSLGASVLPSISGDVVNVHTLDANINHSTTNYTLIVVGQIKNMSKQPLEHNFTFTSVLIYIVVFENGQKIGQGFFPSGYPISFHCDAQIGIVANHIICAKFIFHYLFNDSPMHSRYCDMY